MARTDTDADAPTGSAADFLPARRSLPALRDAAAGCRGCHLWQVGTQTVFGEGATHAAGVFRGGAPGGLGGWAGKAFGGPGGEVAEGGVGGGGHGRGEEVVPKGGKAFKGEGGGKRRIHQKPNWAE